MFNFKVDHIAVEHARLTGGGGFSTDPIGNFVYIY